MRRRARDAGMSLQAYMRARVVEWGATRTDDELFAELDSIRAANRGTGVTSEQIVQDLRDLRDSR